MFEIRRINTRLRALSADAAARISRHPATERGLDRRYRQARAGHADRLPQPHGEAGEMVARLRAQGIATSSLAALGLGASGLLAEARQVCREQADWFVAQARDRDFVVAAADAMQHRPGLYRFGLQHRLLDIVEAYLGVPIGYDGVVLQYSPADGRAAATREWHRDREDRSVVKIAVYLDDVGPEDGPFELVDDSLAGTAEAAGTPICCTGPAGTILFADTGRHLHRGRPITGGRPRLALFFSYFARRPRHPWYCARTGVSRRQVRDLTAGLDARQRQAAAWRQDLPLLARLVPTAPL